MVSFNCWSSQNLGIRGWRAFPSVLLLDLSSFFPTRSSFLPSSFFDQGFRASIPSFGLSCVRVRARPHDPMPYNLPIQREGESQFSLYANLSPSSSQFANSQQHGGSQLSSSQSSSIVSVPRNDGVENQTGLVISKIEEILETMVDVLAEGGTSLTIPIRSRTSSHQVNRVLSWPGKSLQEATRFSGSSPSALKVNVSLVFSYFCLHSARALRILELSREALVSGRLITKRYVFAQSVQP